MNNTKHSPQPNAQPERSMQGRSRRTGLGCSLALVVALLALVAAVVVGGPRLLALVDQTAPVSLPLEDETSPETLAAHREQELAQLHGYSWIDEAGGVARIPIERAINLMVETGLPVGGAEVAATESSTGTTEVADVNYQDDILPIFEQHCAECHGEDDPEEGLQLTTYEGTMAGSIYGSVIKPGNPDDSYLVELVVTGQMPKRGPDLSQAEIDTIIAWINAGAPETGSAPADASVTETVTATQPTTDLANVSFQTDVLPLFTEYCGECHGEDEPEEGLVLTSYKDVMAGSIYGSVVKPGEPDESYLVELVSTGQMPKRGEDLSEDQIAVIVAWIEAGALEN